MRSSSGVPHFVLLFLCNILETPDASVRSGSTCALQPQLGLAGNWRIRCRLCWRCIAISSCSMGFCLLSISSLAEVSLLSLWRRRRRLMWPQLQVVVAALLRRPHRLCPIWSRAAWGFTSVVLMVPASTVAIWPRLLASLSGIKLCTPYSIFHSYSSPPPASFHDYLSLFFFFFFTTGRVLWQWFLQMEPWCRCKLRVPVGGYMVLYRTRGYSDTYFHGATSADMRTLYIQIQMDYSLNA